MRSSRPLSYCMHHTVFTTFFNRFLLVIMSSPAVDAYVKKVVETGNIWLLDHNCVVIRTLDKSNRRCLLLPHHSHLNKTINCERQFFNAHVLRQKKNICSFQKRTFASHPQNNSNVLQTAEKNSIAFMH